MTSVQLAIRPAGAGRVVAASLLVAAGFAAGIGAAQLAPQAFGTAGAAPAIAVTRPTNANAGLSPDERQERASGNARVEIPNQGLSPDERSER